MWSMFFWINWWHRRQSNSPCIPPQQQSEEQFNKTCKIDSDCFSLWLQCDLRSKICVYKSKVCPNECSGQGSCVFSNSNTGKEVPTCLVSDVTCVATCHCINKFSGVSCEIDISNLVFRQNTRSTLIMMLYNITHIDNINSQSIVSWSNSLSTLSQNPYELRIKDAAISHYIANDIVSNALLLSDQSYDNLQGVLQSLNAIYSVTIFNYISSLSSLSGNILNISGTYYLPLNNLTAERVLTTLNRFSNLITNNMVEGQNETKFDYSNFRLTNQVRKIKRSDNI